MKKIKKFFRKHEDRIGHFMFKVIVIIISPVLFIYGGIVCIFRYYRFVRDTVHEKVPKQYYF